MKIFKISVMIAAIYITVCLVTLPEVCISAVKGALSLCGTAVIPTLFPFFVCSSLFVSLGLAEYASKYLGRIMWPLFRTDGAGAVAVVLGIISGYPVGAKCAADLYSQNKLSKPEAERLIAFCNNSGPMFIMGTVGVVIYHSMRVGVVLYCVHIISSLLTGLIYARLNGGYNKLTHRTVESDNKINNENIFADIGRAIGSGVNTVLKVCGFVVFFAVVGATLPNFFGREFVYSFLEITGGINALSSLEFDSVLKLSLVSLFLALSGISVFLQVGAIVADYGISIRSYICGKLIQSIIAFAATYILCFVLKCRNCLDWLIGAESPVFALSDANMQYVDIGLWHLSGAIEACGWCAALIIGMVLLCHMIDVRMLKFNIFRKQANNSCK